MVQTSCHCNHFAFISGSRDACVGLAAAGSLGFGSCQTQVWQLPNSGSLGFGSCQPGLAVAKLWFTRVWQLPNSGLADAKLWFTRVWQLPNSGSHSGLSAGHRLAPEIWDKFWAPTPKPRRMTADAWTSSGCGPQPLSIEHTEPACTPKSQTTFLFDSCALKSHTGAGVCTQITAIMSTHASTCCSASSLAWEGCHHILRSRTRICRSRTPTLLLPNTGTADLCTSDCHLRLHMAWSRKEKTHRHVSHATTDCGGLRSAVPRNARTAVLVPLPREKCLYICVRCAAGHTSPQLPNSGLAAAKLWFTRVWHLPNLGLAAARPELRYQKAF